MILVIDYGRGNLFSLGQALRHLRAEYEISDNPASFRKARRIILPGVGAFGDAMDQLMKRRLVEPLKQAAADGVPILGICVGCQLLLSRGEEFGLHEGLDLIPGTVSRLPAPQPNDPNAIRIPNVGWRQLSVRAAAPILEANANIRMMYFVHSYAPMVEHYENVAATIHVNGKNIPVAIHRENVLGVQFHPEKSGPAGLRFLAGFIELSLPARAEKTLT